MGINTSPSTIRGRRERSLGYFGTQSVSPIRRAEIAPVLSAPGAGTPTTTGTTNAVVTTTGISGTLFRAVVTNLGSCTTAQLKAGTGGNIVASSGGQQPIDHPATIQTVALIIGLTTGTLYQIKFLHTNSQGIDSAQASIDLTTA